MRGPDETQENKQLKNGLNEEKSINSQSGKENNISERLPQEELRGGNEIHSREQEASSFIKGSLEAARKKQQGQLSQHETEDLERQSAYTYAKDHNLWIDDLYSLGHPFSGGGNENTLAYDEKNGIIYKANNLFNSHQSILKFIDGIRAHNKLFPENKYELVGFTGHNIRGKPYVEPIVKQDYIPDATQATQFN